MTEDDIKIGYPGSGRLCPVARAAVRCIPGAYDVVVTRDIMHVFYGTKKGWKEYKVLESLNLTIEEFDVFKTMKPFKMEITL